MNFASAPFILVFLPVVLGLFHAARGAERRLTLMIAASALFYVSAGWQNAVVLGASIVGNYGAGAALLAVQDQGRRKALMWPAVIANVGLLLAFKIRILGAEGPDGFTAAEDVLLPLALSFVTFHQIGFIAAIYRGTVRAISPRAYLFFILFFPHLVMGPIVRYQDIAGQLDEGALAKVETRWVATGLAVFSLALAKKLLVANSLAQPTEAIFAAARSSPISTPEAWAGVAGFQLQLFFDFTAYAEMAIGLAMMFGMRLPLNFDRPYHARDRADLWRRWHISFATFMRGNVFLPLARNWRWPIPAALAVTGILSGLWHGLGWTFVIWGLAQTAILLLLHWRYERRRRTGGKGLPIPLAIAATFLVTCLLGAMFRAPDLLAARHVYGGLFGFGASELLPGSPLLSLSYPALLALAAALIWIGPDIGQIFRGQWQYTELRSGVRPPPRHWAEQFAGFVPGAAWGVLTGAALAASLIALLAQGGASRFVYVQF